MNAYFGQCGIPYSATWGSGKKDTLTAIGEMLENDIPVIISVGPDMPELFEPIFQGDTDSIEFYNKIDGNEYVGTNSKTNGHYMTVTAIYSATDTHGPMLEVST